MYAVMGDESTPKVKEYVLLGVVIICAVSVREGKMPEPG